MFERSSLVVKAACALVVALVLYRLGLAIIHINPLYHVSIPALPELASAGVAGGTNLNTNSSGSLAKSGTNTAAQPTGKGTNTVSNATNLVAGSSNLIQRTASNAVSETNNATHATNLLAQANSSISQVTNSAVAGTNSVNARTNRVSGPGPGQAPQLAQTPMPPGFPGMMPPGAGLGMPPGGMPGMAKPAPALPPEIQARLDRVVDSEILAPVMRPLPLALLGIAGTDVFLRAPNGQTGLVKEGEELGGVKLVRIGINRVLVEQQGEQKELTIFTGLGGESLLSAQKNSAK
jgi:hypothetical protein